MHIFFTYSKDINRVLYRRKIFKTRIFLAFVPINLNRASGNESFSVLFTRNIFMLEEIHNISLHILRISKNSVSISFKRLDILNTKLNGLYLEIVFFKQQFTESFYVFSFSFSM